MAKRNELVSFGSAIFSSSDEKTRLWFSQYLRIGQRKADQAQASSLVSFRRELLRSLRLLLQSSCGRDQPSDAEVVEACAILRLYCALRSAANLKFTDEESSAILDMIVSCPPATPSGVKLVSLSLCMLISCPSLISSGDSEKRAVKWLQSLVREEIYFGHVCQVQSSFGEMLLLIAIHFHSNSVQPISDLVSSTLGMKIQVRSNNLARLKIIFTQDIFTEETITSHAIKVPVTPNLNSSLTGFLPVHCIYQLLRSRAFSKNRVPIREWIFKQICSASAPLHPVLPSLIEAYVTSIMVPSSKSCQTTNQPILESDLHRIFQRKLYSDECEDRMDSDDQPKCLLTTQLLLLYYILLYQDSRLNQSKVQNDRILRHSPEFMSMIPIFFLVQETRRNQEKYGILFHHLLRLTSNHYPHLCMVQDWMLEDSQSSSQPSSHAVPFTSMKNALISLSSRMPDSASGLISLLNRTSRLKNNQIWPFATVLTSILPELISFNTPRPVLDKLSKLWWRLDTVFPDSLWVMTVNALKPKSEGGFKSGKLTWNDIVMDPLNVLRCDSGVYRCPEIMKITLHMLDAFLAASRTFLSQHLLEKPSRGPDEEKRRDEERDREELKIALIAAQESAAIQILLESCLPHGVEATDLEAPGPLKEVQVMVCTHLHQVFISDPNLTKLVHFQTYASRLLPLTVAGIPSMHICLDFIPELLGQPHLAKQIFAIELCSYLSLQVNIPALINQLD